MATNTKFRLVILLSGRGSNFRAIYDYLKKKNLPIEISLVLSDQETAAGVKFAKENNIPTLIVKRNPKEITNQEFNELLALEAKKVNPDLIVLTGFMRVLTNDFIKNFPTKIINIHPSLLPSFRGLHGQKQAFFAGVKFSGCTVHMVTEELDAGPIIAQAIVPVLPQDNEALLSARILQHEHQLLPAVVEAIAFGKIKMDKNAKGEIIIQNNAPLGFSEKDVLFSIKT